MTTRRGELVNEHDRWVDVGDLEVPVSTLVAIARHDVNVAAPAHESLWEDGFVSQEDHEDFQRRLAAADAFLKDYGHLFPPEETP